MYGICLPRLHGLQMNSKQITRFCLLPAQFAHRLRDVYLESNNLSRISFSHTHSSINREIFKNSEAQSLALRWIPALDSRWFIWGTWCRVVHGNIKQKYP